MKNNKPVRWEKQKVDIILNGEVIDKTRSTIEPQIYPTSKIIGDLSTISGKGTGTNDGIFVDDATSFHFEKERYSQSGDGKVDALITSGNIGVVPPLLPRSSGNNLGLTTSNASSG